LTSEPDLKDARKGPDKAESLVVFLHGYGADGADLLGLADVLSPVFPTTAFRAPDAPEPCRGNPMGRQWFPIPWLDGSDPVLAGQSLAASSKRLDAYLTRALADEGLSANQLVLFGFSQGTMMSLHIGPQRPEVLAGIIGFSGRLLEERLPKTRPPILLLHGDQDQMVLFTSMSEAEIGLRKQVLSVETHVMRGTGHGISQDGLMKAVAFLQKVLA
jgi:phospholipase/carboxylesterase